MVSDSSVLLSNYSHQVSLYLQAGNNSVIVLTTEYSTSLRLPADDNLFYLIINFRKSFMYLRLALNLV